MKVSRRGRADLCDAVEITAENIDDFKGVLSKPWIGAWVVVDEKGYAQNFGMRETIEKLYEPAPIRFQSQPGWLGREPVEIARKPSK